MKYLDILRDNLPKLEAEADDIEARMTAITGTDDEHRSLSRDDETALETATTELRAVADQIKVTRTRIGELEAREAAREAARPTVNIYRFSGSKRGPWGDDIDVDRMGPSELRSAAHRGIDALHADARISAEGAEALTEALDIKRSDWTAAARLFIRTGAPAYGSAFGKVLRSGPAAVLEMTDIERAAYAATMDEARALSLVTNGSALVPLTIDPSLTLVGGGSISAVRKHAKQVTIATAEYQAVRTTGVVAAWRAEESVVANATPNATPTTIKAQSAAAFVSVTEELLDDAPHLLPELGELLRDSADQLTAAAFVTGAGTGNVPGGLVTGLAAVPGSVVTVAGGSLESADVRALLGAVPPRHRGAAVFLAGFNAIADIAAMETANGSKVYPSVDSGTILQRTIAEESNMDDSGIGYRMICGDLKAAYTIVNRIGTTIELAPMLFDPASGRPNGMRGVYMRFRCGAAVVAPEAARVLNLTA